MPILEATQAQQPMFFYKNMFSHVPQPMKTVNFDMKKFLLTWKKNNSNYASFF